MGLRQEGNILFCGVGGQGIILASEITSYALIEVGFDVKKSEVHGMAQRGGSVEAHLRYGPKVYSPLIEHGAVDVQIAFEELEAIRYLPYLGPDTRCIVNTQRILPPPVSTGLAGYPTDIIGRMRRKGLEVFSVDAYAEAVAAGEIKTVNIVLVGALSRFLPVKEGVFLDIISARVPKRFLDVNLRAFKRGRALTAKKAQAK